MLFSELVKSFDDKQWPFIVTVMLKIWNGSLFLMKPTQKPMNAILKKTIVRYVQEKPAEFENFFNKLLNNINFAFSELNNSLTDVSDTRQVDMARMERKIHVMADLTVSTLRLLEGVCSTVSTNMNQLQFDRVSELVSATLRRCASPNDAKHFDEALARVPTVSPSLRKTVLTCICGIIVQMNNDGFVNALINLIEDINQVRSLVGLPFQHVAKEYGTADTDLGPHVRRW